MNKMNEIINMNESLSEKSIFGMLFIEPEGFEYWNNFMSRSRRDDL